MPTNFVENIFLKISTQAEDENVIKLLSNLESRMADLRKEYATLLDGSNNIKDAQGLEKAISGVTKAQSDLNKGTESNVKQNAVFAKSLTGLNKELDTFKKSALNTKPEAEQVKALDSIVEKANQAKESIAGTLAPRNQAAEELKKLDALLATQAEREQQVNVLLQRRKAIVESIPTDVDLRTASNANLSANQRLNSANTALNNTSSNPNSTQEEILAANQRLASAKSEAEAAANEFERINSEVEEAERNISAIDGGISNIRDDAEVTAREISRWNVDGVNRDLQETEETMRQVTDLIGDVARFDPVTGELLNADDVKDIVAELETLQQVRNDLTERKTTQESQIQDLLPENLRRNQGGGRSITDRIDQAGDLIDSGRNIGQDLRNGDVRGAGRGILDLFKKIPPQAKIAAAAVAAVSAPFAAFFTTIQKGQDQLEVFTAEVGGYFSGLAQGLGKVGESILEADLQKTLLDLFFLRDRANRQSDGAGVFAQDQINIRKFRLEIKETNQELIASQNILADEQGNSISERLDAAQKVIEIETNLANLKAEAAKRDVQAIKDFQKTRVDVSDEQKEELKKANEAFSSALAQRVVLEQQNRDKLLAIEAQRIEQSTQRQVAESITNIANKQREALEIEKIQAKSAINQARLQRDNNKISVAEFQQILATQEQALSDLESRTRQLDIADFENNEIANVLTSTISTQREQDEITAIQVKAQKERIEILRQNGELADADAAKQQAEQNKILEDLANDQVDRLIASRAALARIDIQTGFNDTESLKILAKDAATLSGELNSLQEQRSRVIDSPQKLAGVDEQILLIQEQIGKNIIEQDIERDRVRLQISENFTSEWIGNATLRNAAVEQANIRFAISEAERRRSEFNEATAEYEEYTASIINLNRQLIESTEAANAAARQEFIDASTTQENLALENTLGTARGNPFIDNIRQEQEGFIALRNQIESSANEIIKIEQARQQKIQAARDATENAKEGKSLQERAGLDAAQVLNEDAINTEAANQTATQELAGSQAENQITEAARGQTVLGRILGVDRSDPAEAAFEDALQNSLDATANFVGDYLALQTEMVDREIEIQERRVDRAATLFERGNAEALNREEAKLDALLEAREKAVRRERALAAVTQATNTALSISNLLVGLSNSTVKGPIAIAAHIAAVVAGIAAITSLFSAFSAPAFIEGTDTDVQSDPRMRKSKKSGGQDGYLARFDGREKILAPKYAQELKHMDQATLVANALLGEQMRQQEQISLLPVVRPELSQSVKSSISSTASNNEQLNRIDIASLRSEMSGMRRDIQGMKVVFNVDANGFFAGYESRKEGMRRMRRQKKKL